MNYQLSTQFFILKDQGFTAIIKIDKEDDSYRLLRTLNDSTYGIRFNPKANDGWHYVGLEDLEQTMSLYPIPENFITPGPRNGWKRIKASFYDNPGQYVSKIDY